MAMTEVARATVTIIPNMQGAQKQITEEFTKAGNKGVESIQTAIEKKASSMKKGMLALAGAGTAAVAAFGIASVKSGAEFDAAMSQVAATMGTTVDDIQNLRDFAKEMGATTAFSATQAAEALNYMALAGYDANTSMQMLPTVLNLAAAGGIELALASDMVTDAQSAFGLSLEETAAMVDQMASASNKSNTSVAQLGEAMLTIGATARNLSGGTQELSTVLGVLADNSIKGAEGGTHLRNIILSLQTPTDDAAKALDDLGVAVYDSDGNMRSLIDIMGDMRNGLDGMDQASQDAIKSGIFNKTDLAAVNALLETSQDRFTELSSAIGDSAGAAKKMAGTQLDNLSGDITLLKSAFEGFQIALSEKLMPVAREVVQFITNLIGHMDVIGPVVAGVATAFGVFAVAINIGSIIKGVTTAFGALNLVLAANPIGIVVAAIAGLVVGIIALWNNCEGFRTVVINVWDAVKTAVKGAVEAIKLQVEALKQKWEEAKQSVASMVGNMISKFDALKSSVKEKWENIKKSITEPIEKARDAVRSAIEKIKGFFNVTLSFPHIKLPHFRITAGVIPWGIGGKGTPPTIGIDWYDKGGIFDAPTIIGVGEKRPEFVGALDDLREIVREESGPTINYGGVTINVNGAGKNAEQLARELQTILNRKAVLKA